jgi:hypothetical protein
MLLASISLMGRSAMAKEFYDHLAESYHLIFQDWEASLRYQADVLARLLPPPGLDVPILDCACGIGNDATVGKSDILSAHIGPSCQSRSLNLRHKSDSRMLASLGR